MTTPSPLTFVTTCPLCGAPLDATEVLPGQTWGPAVLWGYVAQQQHNGRCIQAACKPGALIDDGEAS